MAIDISIEPENFSRRWVAYFDLLGFSELVRSERWSNVFSYYSQTLKRFLKDRKADTMVERAWFSDTFLFYSIDDSKDSFLDIEFFARWFTYFSISHGTPLRGAISCGDFYADNQNSIFFGQALVEAYEYGENQNWLGFLLCPSATEEMQAIGLPADKRLDYAYWEIPYKIYSNSLPRSLPAYIIGGSVETNGKNVCLKKLKEMKSRQTDDRLLKKYDNTIRFILSNRRKIVQT